MESRLKHAVVQTNFVACSRSFAKQLSFTILSMQRHD